MPLPWHTEGRTSSDPKPILEKCPKGGRSDPEAEMPGEFGRDSGLDDFLNRLGPLALEAVPQCFVAFKGVGREVMG